MRLNLESTACERVLIARVFARPGTPSRRMCPLARRPIRRFSTRCFCPTMTLFISIVRMSTKELSLWMRSFNSLMFMLSINMIFDIFAL